jgi:hypothetical protein
MLNRTQITATWWWLRRRQRFRTKRRYYIRPAHQNHLADSFRLFQRYYESEDPLDLEGFCRLSPTSFDNLYAQIEEQISQHVTNHRRPITGKHRLAIFLR